MARDLRKYATQTKFRLILGLFILVFTVGLGLIGWLYERGSAIMGLLCLLGTLLPVSLIGIFLLVLNFIVKKAAR